MAIFAITTNAAVNQPPNQIGNKTLNLDYNELYIFTLANFTNGTLPPYQDPEGDPAEQIKILTLPTVGTLSFNSGPVISGDELDLTDITAGLLTYQCDPADLDGYVDNTFTFDLSDSGSNTFSGLTPGIITFNVAEKINLPPSAVGDNSLVTDYGQTITFTVANFTTETTPVYADPEGDAAECLKVTSLPTEGVLELNSTPVTVNQEILFSDIALGLFTFVPNNANFNTYGVNFNFAIKDIGSGQYTE